MGFTLILLVQNLQAARLDYCTSTKVGGALGRGKGVISDMCRRERLDLSEQI